MHDERMLNGLDLKIFEGCPCKDIQDDVFHDFFRRVDWSEANLKYLNKVQDRWSIYC